jgi:hypothetical protein
LLLKAYPYPQDIFKRGFLVLISIKSRYSQDQQTTGHHAMNEHRESRDYPAFIMGNSVVDMRGKASTVWGAVSRLCRVVMLVIAATAAVAVSTGDWGLRSAMADRKPTLKLTVTGPQTAETGKPLDGINVRLINPGLAAQDSRLRLFIHDGSDRDLGPNNIKIEVLEGSAWKTVQVEPIDGGVMGAMGAEGKPHDEHHKHGGFVIEKNANKTWRLRVTFGLSGHYSLVVAVSPDNGSTHLAQPTSLSMEAL